MAKTASERVREFRARRRGGAARHRGREGPAAAADHLDHEVARLARLRPGVAQSRPEWREQTDADYRAYALQFGWHPSAQAEAEPL